MKHLYSDTWVLVTGASLETLTQAFLSFLSFPLILAGSQLWTPLPVGGGYGRVEGGREGQREDAQPSCTAFPGPQNRNNGQKRWTAQQ